MEYERGGVIEAGDPFNEEKSRRPFMIVNTMAHPFDGDQYVAIALTTRTWYDATIPFTDEDFLDGGLPKDSSLAPWVVVSLSHDDILDWFGRTESAPLDEALDRFVGISGSNRKRVSASA